MRDEFGEAIDLRYELDALSEEAQQEIWRRIDAADPRIDNAVVPTTSSKWRRILDRFGLQRVPHQSAPSNTSTVDPTELAKDRLVKSLRSCRDEVLQLVRDWWEGSQRDEQVPHETPLFSLGPFQVLAEIGQGGSACVYRAWEDPPQRLVALKVLKQPYDQGRDSAARIFREARQNGKLYHPGIVPLYESKIIPGQIAGKLGHRICYSMPLVAGGNLRRFIDAQPNRRLEPKGAAEMVRSIAYAVGYAHQKEVVHCDLKPENILVEKDGSRPRIVDFGVARTLRSDEARDPGSARYSSPEQQRRRRAKAESDIYSLGIVLHELVAGCRPFNDASLDDASVAKLLEEKLKGPGECPQLVAAEAPADLIAIIQRCLQPQPSRRYASADALANDLGLFLQEKEVSVRLIGLTQKAFRLRRRHPRTAALVAVALGLLLLLAIGGPVAALVMRQLQQTAETSALVARTSERTALDKEQQRALEARRAKEFARRGRQLAAATSLAEAALIQRSAESEEERQVEKALNSASFQCRSWDWNYLNALVGSERVFGDLTSGRLSAFDLSPNGDYIVVGDEGGRVKVQDTTNLNNNLAEWLHEAAVRSVQFLSNSRTVMSADANGTVKFWNPIHWDKLDDFKDNTPDYKLLGELKTDGLLHSAAISPAEDLLAVASSGKLRLYEWPAQKLRFSCNIEFSGQPCVAFQPDQQFVIVADDQHSQLYDCRTGSGRFTKRLNLVRCVEFLPDSSGFLGAVRDAGLHAAVFDFRAKSRLRFVVPNGMKDHKLTNDQALDMKTSPTGPPSPVVAVAVHPEGRLAATAQFNGVLKLWDLATMRVLHQAFSPASMPIALRFSRDGKMLALADVPHGVRTWSLDHFPPTRRIATVGSVFDMDATADGHRAVLACHDGKLRVLDLEQGRVDRVIPLSDVGVVAVALGRGGQWAAAATRDKKLRIVPLTTDANPAELTGFDEPVSSLRVTRDGCTLFAASGNKIVVFDLVNRRPVTTWEKHTKRIRSIKLARDESLLVSVASDEQTIVWNRDGSVKRQFKGGSMCCAISDDNRLIATIGPNVLRGPGAFQPLAEKNGISVWDIETGERRAQLSEDALFVSDLTFTADGQRVVAGTTKVEARFWDIATGRRTMLISQESNSWVKRVMFADDGRRFIMSGGYMKGFTVVLDAPPPWKRSRLENGASNMTSSLSSDSGLLATAGLIGSSNPEKLFGDANLDVVDTNNGVTVFSTQIDDGQFTDVAICPKSSQPQVAAALSRWVKTENGLEIRSEHVYLYDVTTQKVIHRLPGGTHLAFRPDGKLLAVGNEKGEVAFWDPDTGTAVRRSLTGFEHGVAFLAYTPDGNELIVSSFDRKIRRFDMRQDAPEAKEIGETSLFTRSFVFSPDKKSIIVACCMRPDGKPTDFGPAELLEFNLETVQPPTPWQLPTTDINLFSLSFSPDGQYLLLAYAPDVQRTLVAALDAKSRQTVQKDLGLNAMLLASCDQGPLVAAVGFQSIELLDAAALSRHIARPVSFELLSRAETNAWHFEEVAKLEERGEPAAACFHLDHLLSQPEQQGAALFARRGRLQMILKRVDDAKADLDAAGKFMTNDWKVQRDLGRLALLLGDYPLAVRYLQPAANAKDADGEVYGLLARSLHELNQDERVEDLYQRAIRLIDPALLSSVRTALGKFYLDRGECRKAVDELTRALADDGLLPNLRAGALCDRANAFRQLGLWKMSIHDCDEAKRLDPKERPMEVAVTRVAAYVGLEDWRDAEMLMSEIVDLEPTTNNRAARAWIRAEVGENVGARDDLLAAQKEPGPSLNDLWFVAAAYLRLDDVVGYQAFCSKLLETHEMTTQPDDAAAIVGVCLWRQVDKRDRERLQKLAKVAFENAPNDANDSRFKGRLLLRTGQPAAAVPLFEKALEANPRVASIRLELALARFEVNHQDKTVTELVADAENRIAELLKPAEADRSEVYPELMQREFVTLLLKEVKQAISQQ